MLSNKDIVDSYKKTTPKKRSSAKGFKLSNTQGLILLAAFSVAPTLALGLYLNQPILQMVFSLVFAFISYWIILLLVSMVLRPLLGGVTSNPSVYGRADRVALLGSVIAFIPQILYILYVTN